MSKQMPTTFVVTRRARGRKAENEGIRTDARRHGGGDGWRGFPKAAFLAAVLTVSALVVIGVQIHAATMSSPTRPASKTVWEAAEPVRLGSGGYEAERDTWVCERRKFEQTVERSGQQWTIKVAGDTRPIMRRMRLEALGRAVDSPFLLSDKNYDFRSVPDLVRSVTQGAKTPEEKALAIRELLIGEGFYFHFAPPPSPDPIHRLTNAGYGFCSHHAQIFDELGQAAGLRTATCNHSFGNGHGTNQVYYDGQWHFIDSDAEVFIRRPDGVIPSYDDIRQDPNLMPAGDAYGQTSFGISGVRLARALYTAPIECYERVVSPKTRYATLSYSLRPGESITWDWQDADFRRNRENKLPLYGTGTIEDDPKLEDFRQVEGKLTGSGRVITLAGDASAARLQMRVQTPYPVLEVKLSARLEGIGAGAGFAARISGDNGKTWVPLEMPDSNPGTWLASVPKPDEWENQPDSEEITKSSRLLTAGRYGYLLELTLQRESAAPVSLSNLKLETVFRQYPPALPFLKVGQNTITYVNGGPLQGQVRVSLEWEERRRAPQLSAEAAEWGWAEPTVLSRPGEPASLPTIAKGAGGRLHLVYAIGTPGSRRVAWQRYHSGVWSEAEIVTPPVQDANHPVVAEDGNGTIWIAYQTGGLWAGGDIWIVSLRGSRHSDPVRLNTTDPRHVAFFPSITAHGRQVTVSWEGGQIDKDEKTEWGEEVGWVRSYDGAAWGEPILIKGKPYTNLGLPKILYDARGRLHLTGTKGPRYYLTLSESIDRFQWLTPEWTYHSRGAAFCDDAGGNLWAAFDGQTSGTTNEIYVRMLDARSSSTSIDNWTQSLRVSEDDKKPSIYPDIYAHGPDQVALVWMDYRHKNAEVYGKVFEASRWSPDVLLSRPAPESARRKAEAMTPNQVLWAHPEGLQSEYPHLAGATDGTVWAVWQETVDGNAGRIMGLSFRWPEGARSAAALTHARTKVAGEPRLQRKDRHGK